MSKAARFNKGKLKLELIPPEFEEELGRILTKGATKYADDNWKESINTEDHDAFCKDRVGSLKRHMNKYLQGEFFDDEVVKGAEDLQTSHLGHIAVNALFIYFYEIKRKGRKREANAGRKSRTTKAKVSGAGVTEAGRDTGNREGRPSAIPIPQTNPQPSYPEAVRSKTVGGPGWGADIRQPYL